MSELLSELILVLSHLFLSCTLLFLEILKLLFKHLVLANSVVGLEQPVFHLSYLRENPSLYFINGLVHGHLEVEEFSLEVVKDGVSFFGFKDRVLDYFQTLHVFFPCSFQL